MSNGPLSLPNRYSGRDKNSIPVRDIGVYAFTLYGYGLGNVVPPILQNDMYYQVYYRCFTNFKGVDTRYGIVCKEVTKITVNSDAVNNSVYSFETPELFNPHLELILPIATYSQY